MKCLFVQPGGLGDFLMAAPHMHRLSQEGNTVHVLLEPRTASGARQLSGDMQVREFDLRARTPNLPKLWQLMRGYDTVIASGGSPLVAVLLALSGAPRRIGYDSSLGFLLTDRIERDPKTRYGDLFAPLLNSQPQPGDFLRGKLAAPDFSGEYLLLHPGVSQVSIGKGITKTPDARYWQRLIVAARERYPGMSVVLAGGPDDEALCRELASDVDALVLRPELPELAGWLASAQVCFCADSAPMHLAIAAGARVVALFGPTDPVQLVPPGVGNYLRVVQVPSLACQPCLWLHRSRSCELPICVRWQDPTRALEAADELLPGGAPVSLG